MVEVAMVGSTTVEFAMVEVAMVEFAMVEVAIVESAMVEEPRSVRNMLAKKCCLYCSTRLL